MSDLGATPRTAESSLELGTALTSFQEHGQRQAECATWAYYALLALLVRNSKEAINSARRSRELADVNRFERDIIRGEWLCGWALIHESPSEAETHLGEALTRCRRINLVEFEPDILLAWARWHRAAGHVTQARRDAEEALTIADRCQYRLVQADVHNFLAQLALDANDRAAARREATIGRERAWCDGPPHCYKPAVDDADAILAKF